MKDGGKRFGWNPKQFLEQLIDLYLSLSSDQFAQDIAQDEVGIIVFRLIFCHSSYLCAFQRSYIPETMESIHKTILRIQLNTSKVEKFKNLSEMAEQRFYQMMQSGIMSVSFESSFFLTLCMFRDGHWRRYPRRVP